MFMGFMIFSLSRPVIRLCTLLFHKVPMALKVIQTLSSLEGVMELLTLLHLFCRTFKNLFKHAKCWGCEAWLFYSLGV